VRGEKFCNIEQRALEAYPGGNGAQLLVGLRRQRGLSQKLLAPKAGGSNQTRLSALELHPGRFTVEQLLLILTALDLVLVVRSFADLMNGERARGLGVEADTRVSGLVFRTAGVITAV
jgi:hypothetical protein